MKYLSIDEQFESLRARIEAAIDLPAAVVVSSACQGDGKSVTAFGLAASLSAAGYRAALIDADHLSPSFETLRAPVNLHQFVDGGPREFAHSSPEGFDVIAFTNDTLRRGASRHSVPRALGALRAAYDVVVIDAPSLVESNLGLLFAKNAQAVVLTICVGRSIERADHDMVRTLEREAIPVLGTVSVSRSMINDFVRTEMRRGATISSISQPVETVRRKQAVS